MSVADAEVIEADHRTAELGDALIHLVRMLERTRSQAATRRSDDLDRSAYVALFHLLHAGPQRSGALAEAMLADPSTVSRHVTQLVDRGLVQRQADPDDGRATQLAITELGHSTALRVRARRNAMIGQVVAEWEPAERDRLTTLLGRFTTDLETTRPQILADCDEQDATGGES